MSLLDLVAKIEKLPLEKQVEVADFVDFLVSKNQHIQAKKRVYGSGKGMVEMMPNFDEPLTDFKEYM